MAGELTAITAGTSFVISDGSGDISPRTDQGFFALDTRFLSAFKVQVQERPLTDVHSGRPDHSHASFYTVNQGRRNLPRGSIGVVRDRYVATGFHEDLHVINYGMTPYTVKIDITMDADFADLFEVRRGEFKKAGKTAVESREGYQLCFSYQRYTYRRETWVQFSEEPEIIGRTARFTVTLEPKGRWKTCISVFPMIDIKPEPMPCVSMTLGSPFEPSTPSKNGSIGLPRMGGAFSTVPTLETDSEMVSKVYAAALNDLHSLQIHYLPGEYIFAAGLPWFMAVFGRDSIISAIQTKMLGQAVMVGTLRTLAAVQATIVDPFRGAEPGKIPHEIREGELSRMGEVPHSCYYGSVDSTPLFLRLLLETYQWTGDLSLLRELLPQAEKALMWINRFGDVDRDGFVEYVSHTPKRWVRSEYPEDVEPDMMRPMGGLRNQGWKDSDDSICFANGLLATGPLALAEVQGYVYDAKRSMAEVYRLLGQEDQARRLDSEALMLQQNFDDAFWMPEEGFYAIALDGKKRRVDGISSNPGHCLWSGIVPESRAKQVVERLMAPDMFDGWGIRTLSSEMVRFNPLSYHNGSIWPHDNSIIAAGMASCGFAAEAHKVAYALLEAATGFPNNSLPELFSGYPRRKYSSPVPYPFANSPQAWACGAVIYFLETLLNLSIHDDRLVVYPRASDGVQAHLRGVSFRGGRLDI